MARLIYQHAYPTLRLAGSIDFGRLAYAAIQVAVLGGIGLFIALAIVNAIMGTSPQEPAYTPYE